MGRFPFHICFRQAQQGLLAQFKHYVENEKQDAVRLGPIVAAEKPTPPEPVSRFKKNIYLMV